MTDPKFSSPVFVYADGITSTQIRDAAEAADCLALSEAERSSLVKRTKCRTVIKPSEYKRDLSVYEPIKEIDETIPVFEANSIGPGMFTVVQYREWSDEYRIRTRVETSLTRPPLVDGPRYSNMLSTRGARKITESCYYMAKCHGGFKTFITGTFTEEIRKNIKQGKTTIQREVSRTMNAMQKMYQRGWTHCYGVRIKGHDGPLAYCWVVEIPTNENGEENPHVHMMINWRVERKLFDDWSARIESIWGNGYFHLEKIRDPLCAGAYMAKAAGYMTKAAKQDNQGYVKGNRYGISKTARAPGWYTISESELGIMGRLIHEIHERCQAKYGNLYSARTHLKKSLEECSKENKKTRLAIGRKLQQIRAKIDKIPIIASKYQIIFKGSGPLSTFLGWAAGAGWSAIRRPTSKWLDIFNRKLRWNRNQRLVKRLAWTDHDWAHASTYYGIYSRYEEQESPMQEYSCYSRALAISARKLVENENSASQKKPYQTIG